MIAIRTAYRSRTWWGLLAAVLFSPVQSARRLSTRWISCRNRGISFKTEAIEGVPIIPVSRPLCCHRLCFRLLTVNGVRQAGADGRSLTQISSVINAPPPTRHSTLRNLRIPMAMGSRIGLSTGVGDLSQAGGETPTGMDFPTFGKMSSGRIL